MSTLRETSQVDNYMLALSNYRIIIRTEYVSAGYPIPGNNSRIRTVPPNSNPNSKTFRVLIRVHMGSIHAKNRGPKICRATVFLRLFYY